MFPFLKQAEVVIHFLSLLIIIQLFLWNKERKSAVGHVLLSPDRLFEKSFAKYPFNSVKNFDVR